MRSKLYGLAACVALAAVALAVVSFASASSSTGGTSTTIRVSAKSTSFNQVGSGIGSITTFTDDLFQSGKLVGTDVVACVATGPGTVQECYATDTLPKGQIQSVGMSDPVTETRFTVSIVGGTGAYRDARGTIDIELLNQTDSTYVYHVDGVSAG